ncbi:MAG: carbohydrate ABC transporter permease [Thermomicrobiales bacterium]|nr:carbohydrate ABC transporter permease [Thermomicrobiales bacterium]
MSSRLTAKRVIIYICALLVALWTLVPFYWLLNLSFMFNVEMNSAITHFYPHDFTWSNYVRLFNRHATGPGGVDLLPIPHGQFIRTGLKNSLIVAGVTTPLTLLIAMPCAYVLGRYVFPFRNSIVMAILLSRAYPAIAAIIPLYKMWSSLGLRGTHHGLVIVYLSITVPLVVWIMMGFFNALPRSLESAARVDGCTRFQTLYRVVLPTSLPGIAACAVIAFLLVWNDFLFAFLLATGSSALTFPPTLSNMFFQYSYPTEASAATVLGVLPVAIVAFVFQRWIRKLNIVDPL